MIKAQKHKKYNTEENVCTICSLARRETIQATQKAL